MPDVEWNSRGAEKVFADNEKVLKSVRDTGNAYKDSARDAQDMGRIVTKITKDNATAYENFARQIVNAKHAKDADKVSTEQLHRETTRLTVEYLRQTDGVRKLTDAERHKIDVKRRYHAQIEHEIQMQPKLRSSTEQLMGTHTMMGAELGNLAFKHKEAFDPAHLMHFLPHALSVAGAVHLISENFEKMAERANEAADAAVDAIGGVGELAQVADSPEHRAHLKHVSEQLVERGIATDMRTATQIQFNLASAGIKDKEQEDIFKLAEKGYIAPENIVPVSEAVGKFRKNFGGTVEGTMDVLAQSAKGTFANLSKSALASLEFGEVAARRGISREESLAAFVPLEQRAELAGTGATQLRAFLDEADASGFKSKTIEGLLAEADAKVKRAGGNVSKVFGRKEARSAYGILSKFRGEFLEQKAAMQTADERNFASEQAELNMGDPELRAALAAKRAKGQEKIADERAYGERVNLGRAVFSARMKKATDRGYFSAFGEQLDQSVLGAGLSWNQVIMGEMRGGYQNVDAGTRADIEKYLRRTDQLGGKEMDRIADQLSAQTDELKKQTSIMERNHHEAPKPHGRAE
jgi:hypothetical protein